MTERVDGGAALAPEAASNAAKRLEAMGSLGIMIRKMTHLFYGDGSLIAESAKILERAAEGRVFLMVLKQTAEEDFGPRITQNSWSGWAATAEV
jgi:hypothetical protein